jgi:predicted amidophosphoribosyltransferase
MSDVVREGAGDAMAACPACLAHLPADARFCLHCGRPAERARCRPRP